MTGLAIDASGNIYAADGYNDRVMKWAPGATTGTLVAGGNGTGSNSNQLNFPIGIFYDSNTSTIYIADTNNHRIVKWPSPTMGIIVCGSNGSGSNQFNTPRGLFVDIVSNILYVADSGNHRIQKWFLGATSGTTVAGQTGNAGSGLSQLNGPRAVVVDEFGNMYISDSGNNRVLRWAASSSFGVVIAGGNGAGLQPNQFNFNYGISFDSNGSLYVVDANNNRVQKFAFTCGE